MEAKEKANELVVSFYTIMPESSNEYGMDWDMAKKCALIAVDEIINSGALNDEEIYVSKPSYVGYWEEVKQEIENL